MAVAHARSGSRSGLSHAASLAPSGSAGRYALRVSLLRRCSRTACGRPATTTLTYVYADQTAVLGPLATYAEPHAYDLCEVHSERLSAPRGWEVLRLVQDDPHAHSSDDLLALADAVREAAQPRPVHDAGHERAPFEMREVARKGHLRVLRSED
jgi:hypothetical protein